MACSHSDLETHSDMDVNAAGVHREYWLECSICGMIFGEDNDPSGWHWDDFDDTDGHPPIHGQYSSTTEGK